MRTIRASEIGQYLYCQRAWWYQRQGIESENQEDLASGVEMHQEHGKRVLLASLTRLVAVILLLAALVVATIYLTNQFLVTY